MKTLIVYSSRHGTAQKIAHLLSMEIRHGQARLLDLRTESAPENLESYEQVIIGGSIHYGNIQRAIQKFCRDHENELLHKRIGLFLCFMNDEQAQEEFDRAYPVTLRNHARALGLFGGEYLFEKMNMLERFIVSKIAHENETTYHIDEAAVESFILKMNQ